MAPRRPRITPASRRHGRATKRQAAPGRASARWIYYPSLVPAAAFGPAATRLNPVFRIGNRKFVLDTALMAAVPRKLLGARVATLADRSVDIVGAVDSLVSGIRDPGERQGRVACAA